MGNFNGCLGGSRVWEFKGDGCTWITWSVGYDQPTPRAGSALSEFSSLTPCTDLAPSVMVDKVTAAGVAKLVRQIRRNQGMTILHDRDFTLPGPAKPVAGCRSIRELSRTLGVSFRRARSIYADFSDDAAGETAVR